MDARRRGRSYLASKVPDLADEVMVQARAKAMTSPDLFPADARADLGRLARLDDVDKARMAGMGLLEIERQDLERGKL